jgi:hypothetical protein
MDQYSSSLLTWSGRTGSVEASDLRWDVARTRNPLHFAIVSDRTGARREFYRQSIFYSDAQKYVTHDSLPQLSVTVFND